MLLEQYRDAEVDSADDTADYLISTQAPSQIVEALGAWVQVCSLDGAVETVNAAARNISGYSAAEMVGQPWPYPWLATECGEDGVGLYAALYSSGQPVEFEGECLTKSGERVPMAVKLTLLQDRGARPDKVLLVGWDLRKHLAAEADARQAQKVQAVNQLASGVAHDINNNLAVILGYAEFLLSKYRDFNDDFQQALNAIRDQSMDCANTVRRVQLFSRPVPRSQMAKVTVNEVVREVVEQAQRAWEKGGKAAKDAITVKLDLGQVPPVFAYRTGLNDALASLVHNAADALPQGGLIRVRTGCRDGQVDIEVSDDGTGIAPAHLGRIFDPFFTTKGPATSGLGLSIAYNLVTQQGGDLLVDSQPGHGTTFTVRMLLEDQETPPPPEAETRGPQRSLSALVVDDEPLVAEVLRTFLESLGHRAVTRSSGAKALEVFSREAFDLAVVDLGMEGMDGWELARHINSVAPDFPVILATGWDVTVENARDRGVNVQAVLKKPFQMAELSRALEQAMGYQLSG